MAVAIPSTFGIMHQHFPNRRVTPIADGNQRLRRERILHSAVPGVHSQQIKSSHENTLRCAYFDDAKAVPVKDFGSTLRKARQSRVYQVEVRDACFCFQSLSQLHHLSGYVAYTQTAYEKITLETTVRPAPISRDT